MLVLSRKASDKVLFPTVGITVEVLSVRGNTTRLGIDAPPEIPICRHEIADLKSIEFAEDEASTLKLSRLANTVRVRLDAAATALNQLHQQFDGDADSTVQELIIDVYRELKALDREANRAIETPDVPAPRALLVEPDASERRLLSSYLRMHGIETTIAMDGRDALGYLSLHAAPDIVLLDMQTPGCDGRCLVRSIRSAEGFDGLKLFAVCSTNPSLLGIATGPDGIDRWFQKPVDPEHLVNEIAEELGVTATAV
jgi:carbon storage regulator CsrA